MTCSCKQVPPWLCFAVSYKLHDIDTTSLKADIGGASQAVYESQYNTHRKLLTVGARQAGNQRVAQ